MRFLIPVVLALTVSLSATPEGASASIFDIPVQPMSAADGRTSATTLRPFKGKVLLVVNVASKCGFTRQYAQLESIYQRYRDQGLEILAFPSNQFGNQEPGSEEDIVAFCSENYNITFPMFAKVDVTGPNAAPLFRFLTEGDHAARSQIRWNFNKFLIGRDGTPLAHFGSMVRPDSRQMIQAIEAALAAKP
jgi:glutathione peroxidase